MAIHEVFIYLRAHDARAAIAFYTAAFGAEELFRLEEPSGRIGHAELRIGPSTVMVSDAFPEFGIHAPAAGETVPAGIHLHVDDADALIERAVAAGADLIAPAEDHFYGERSGKVRDPFGYVWMIGHALETLTPAEMQRRYTALLSGDGTGG